METTSASIAWSFDYPNRAGDALETEERDEDAPPHRRRARKPGHREGTGRARQSPSLIRARRHSEPPLVSRRGLAGFSAGRLAIFHARRSAGKTRYKSFIFLGVLLRNT